MRPRTIPPIPNQPGRVRIFLRVKLIRCLRHMRWHSISRHHRVKHQMRIQRHNSITHNRNPPQRIELEINFHPQPRSSSVTNCWRQGFNQSVRIPAINPINSVHRMVLGKGLQESKQKWRHIARRRGEFEPSKKIYENSSGRK